MTIDQALKEGKDLVSKYKNAELDESTIYIIDKLIKYIEENIEDDMK